MYSDDRALISLLSVLLFGGGGLLHTSFALLSPVLLSLRLGDLISQHGLRESKFSPLETET